MPTAEDVVFEVSQPYHREYWALTKMAVAYNYLGTNQLLIITHGVGALAEVVERAPEARREELLKRVRFDMETAGSKGPTEDQAAYLDERAEEYRAQARQVSEFSQRVSDIAKDLCDARDTDIPQTLFSVGLLSVPTFNTVEEVDRATHEVIRIQDSTEEDGHQAIDATVRMEQLRKAGAGVASCEELPITYKDVEEVLMSEFTIGTLVRAQFAASQAKYDFIRRRVGIKHAITNSIRSGALDERITELCEALKTSGGKADQEARRLVSEIADAANSG